MKTEILKRALNFVDLEVRAADADKPPVVTGHAAVFEKPTLIGGMFREQVLPGAFKKTLKDGADVRFLINHEGLPLARTTSGTLTLREDSKGLLMEAELDPTDPDVQRIVPKMKRGDLNEMSFAFSVVREEWDHHASPPLRSLQELKLFDVSIVTTPAYPEASIKLRSLQAAGIDWERLELLVMLQSRGLVLTDEDRAFVQEVRAVLDGLTPAPAAVAPVVQDHPTDPEPVAAPAAVPAGTEQTGEERRPLAYYEERMRRIEAELAGRSL